MKIQPTNQTNFGLNTSSRIYYYGQFGKKEIDVVNLANGKKIGIYKQFDANNLVSKLQCLTDEAGRWVRSKLRYYKGNKVIKTLESNNKEV